MNILNKRTLSLLPQDIKQPTDSQFSANNQIVHFGIGGFHRSHQAYAIARLIAQDPIAYAKWRITGVGLMPNDKILVDQFKEQDNLYVLKTVAFDNKEESFVIDAIQEMLHADDDSEKILTKIADKNTKIISLTITEGGYNFDFEKNQFQIENPAIQADLINREAPKTIFGFLAKGLLLRKESHIGELTLLSCDNILGNGHVLQIALLTFLEHYDPSLKNWAEKNLSFPNSMVDRITPVPLENDKIDFANRTHVRDNCLVVSEDFFQWVIEKDKGDENFPPLEQVGVEFVEDVAAYEAMKLGILNAGHTLVGFLGDLLHYDRIHTSVQDKLIASVYQEFALKEVIPVLNPIPNVNYETYFNKVRSRFSNAMINDSTARIISGTSDKFPKFVLPIIKKQLGHKTPNIKASALIVAAWWAYLLKTKTQDDMQTVQDNLKSTWQNIFTDTEQSIFNFIKFEPVFSDLHRNEDFMKLYMEYAEAIQKGEIQKLITQKFTQI